MNIMFNISQICDNAIFYHGKSYLWKYVLPLSSFPFQSHFIIFLHFIISVSLPILLLIGTFLNVLIFQFSLFFHTDVFCVMISTVTVHF